MANTLTKNKCERGTITNQTKLDAALTRSLSVALKNGKNGAKERGQTGTFLFDV